MIVHLSFFWGTIGFRTFRKCQWISETLRVSGIFRVVNESKVADWICHFGHDPNLYPFSTDCKRYQMLRVHFFVFFFAVSLTQSHWLILFTQAATVQLNEICTTKHLLVASGSIVPHPSKTLRHTISYDIQRPSLQSVASRLLGTTLLVLSCLCCCWLRFCKSTGVKLGSGMRLKSWKTANNELEIGKRTVCYEHTVFLWACFCCLFYV